jgi:hypothetical protein
MARKEILIATLDTAKLYQMGVKPPDEYINLTGSNADLPAIPYGYIVQENGASIFVPNIDSVLVRGFWEQVAEVDRTPDDQMPD